eukprot:jgi/Bigna1/138778/aug1.46_g13486
MSLLEALQQKRSKLKKTGGEKKQESKPTLICKGSDDYHRLMKETYMEEYWDKIKSLSFPTEFHPLSTKTASALLEASKKFEEDPRAEISKDAVEKDANLSSLAEKISEIAAKNKWSNIFIRLSSRSPKDAAFAKHRFEPLVEAETKNVRNSDKSLGLEDEEKSELNVKLRAIYRASTYCLRVPNGVEAVRLLIESKRIREDLKDFIEGKTDVFNVVVREFATFDPQMEFRAFVNNGKLTALTQYNDLCYFPFVVRANKQIIDRLRDEYEKTLKKKIPLSSCVLDLVFCPGVENDKKQDKETSTSENFLRDIIDSMDVMVIEVNPLAEFAGSGMFQWEKAKDKNILLGVSPFEFRYQSRIPSKGFVRANIAPKWIHVVDGCS